MKVGMISIYSVYFFSSYSAKAAPFSVFAGDLGVALCCLPLISKDFLTYFFLSV